MPPLVSAILPVHNRARSLARAIESVLAQTYTSVELIVVDDGSTDGTPAILDAFGSRVVVIRQPQRGAYAARNVALSRARGDFIAYIDSDDAWMADRLECQMPLFSSERVGLVFGDTEHVTGPPEHPRPTGRTSFAVTPPRRGQVAAHFVWGNFVPTTTVLLRRRVLVETGPFSEAEPVSADFLKWFQVAVRYELEYVDRPVAAYTVHAGGISADLERSLRARIRLFSAELGATTDPALARTLRQLIFNLSLHLAFAAIRGRARPSALLTATRHASGVGSLATAFRWAAALVYHRAARARPVPGANRFSSPGHAHELDAAGRGGPGNDHGPRTRGGRLARGSPRSHS